MPAQVGDAGQPAEAAVRRGDDDQGRQNGDELPDGGQVRVDPAQSPRPGGAHHERAGAVGPGAQLDVGAQARQQPAPGVPALRGGEGIIKDDV